MPKPILLALALLAAVGAGLPFTGAPDAAVQPAAASGHTVENDAGSGQDAGDSPHEALAIRRGSRPYSGNLTPPGVDVDWYVLDATGGEPYCALGNARGNVPGTLVLTHAVERSAVVYREIEPSARTDVALAAPAGTRPFLGLEPASFQTQSLSGDTDKPGPGRYSFDLVDLPRSALDPEGDGESPDGGALPQTAVPFDGPCLAGQLDEADPADHFAFEASSGGTFFVSLAGGDVEVDVLDPTGTVRRTVASGDAAAVWAEVGGTWVLAVRGVPTEVPTSFAFTAASAVEDYVLALSDDPRDTNPCRPSCG